MGDLCGFIEALNPRNTGEAGAIHRVGFFAGMPAPTEVEL